MLKNSVFKPSVSTQKWAKAAGVRAIKTMAQTAIAVIGTGAVMSAGIGEWLLHPLLWRAWYHFLRV